MKLIKKVPQFVTEMDDAGQIQEIVIFGPETPIPAIAVKVVIDDEFYTVYEPGDI